MQPIFVSLMNSRAAEDDWGPKQQGALRSVVANRQWPRSRLFRIGRAAYPNCQLCVALEDRRPKWRGTLTHRHWTCPVTKPHRDSLVPESELDHVLSHNHQV